MAKDEKDYEKDYTHPEMRERIKEELKQSDKGGPAGKWTARKAQLLTQEYEKQGGDYEHKGSPTEEQRSLEQWTEQEWQTADGSAQARDGEKTDRYLPKKAWEQMSAEEQERTRERKQEASKRGAGSDGHVANTSGAKQARAAAELDGMNADDAVRKATSMSPDEAQQALEHERSHHHRKTVEQKLEKVAAKD